MSNPRKHHYVPQVYLKNFAKKKDHSWMVYVRDKELENCYNADIKSIAMEKDYNTVLKLEDKYYWEHFYSTGIELLMSKVLTSTIINCNCAFIKNESLILNKRLKYDLGKILITQLLRTKKARNHQLEISNKVVPSVINFLKVQLVNKLTLEQEEILNSFELTEDLFKDIDLKIINDEKRVNKFVNILMDKVWIIYKNINYQQLPFITSDNPVVMYNINNKSTSSKVNGIAKRYTIIYYPLSSQLLLSIYDHGLFWGELNKYDNKILELDIKKDSKFINNINLLQYKQCIRQVYSMNRFKQNDLK